MSNSSRILANNNEIQSVIDMINALPEAGSSTTETWILTLEDGSTVTKEMVVGE